MLNKLSPLKTLEQVTKMNAVQLAQELREVEELVGGLCGRLVVLGEKMTSEEWQLVGKWTYWQQESKWMSHLRPIVDLAGPESLNWSSAGEWKVWAAAMQKQNPQALADVNPWHGIIFPAQELAAAVSQKGLLTTEQTMEAITKVTNQLSPSALEYVRLEELASDFMIYSSLLKNLVDRY